MEILSKAENEGCNIQAEIFLPNEISIENDDLVVVMGNLLDNAIEAIEKIKENKYIKISVKYDRQCLIVRVINSFDSQINMEKGKIQTRKENSEFHGIGLESVENVVAKYRGNIKIEYKKEIFSVGVVLYPKE